MTSGEALFSAVVRSAIKQDRDFILKGFKLEILAEFLAVDVGICELIRNRVAKLG